MKIISEKKYRIYRSKDYNKSIKQYHKDTFPGFLDEYINYPKRIPALISFDTYEEAQNYIVNLYSKMPRISENELCIADDSGMPTGVTYPDR